jgi:hypothetical protein
MTESEMLKLDPRNPVVRVFMRASRIHPDKDGKIPKPKERHVETVPVASSAPHMPDTPGQRIVKAYF